MSSRVDYVEDYLARYEWKYLLIKGNEPERRSQQSMIPLSNLLVYNPLDEPRSMLPPGQPEQNVYPVRFVCPRTPLPALNAGQPIASILRLQGIIALVGREALSSFVFIYNGPAGSITLAI